MTRVETGAVNAAVRVGDNHAVAHIIACPHAEIENVLPTAAAV